MLVFRGGALGDFILTLPVFQALRRAWPRAEIVLAGIPRIAELARAAGLVDQVLDIESARFAGYHVADTPLPSEESDFLRSFDRVISFLHDPEGVLQTTLERGGARRVLAVPPRVGAGHAADHFLSAVAGPGTGAGRAVPRLELPKPLRAAGRARLNALGLSGPVIVLHPGSGSLGKNWPLASFQNLAERIRSAGLGRVLWTAGEADAAIIRGLEAAGAGRRLLKDAALPEIAAVLSLCRGYVGNDSGVTHLAAAVGTPVLALFGPTDPDIWAPRGRWVAIVRARPPTTEGLARLPVGEVFCALRQLIPAP